MLIIQGERFDIYELPDQFRLKSMHKKHLLGENLIRYSRQEDVFLRTLFIFISKQPNQYYYKTNV